MANYSQIEKLLHRMVFRNNKLNHLLYDMEKFFYLKNNDLEIINSINVTGLARSGTTILLNAIYKSNEFASLTYRDMPFLLSPNFWGKKIFNAKKDYTSSQRKHADRIFINYDSPEAFEEVFWKTHLQKKYIKEKSIFTHTVKEDNIQEYQKYKKIICKKYKKNKYLSKNNNNVLRLESLANFDYQSKYLLVFRNPLTQAYSSLNQHKNFYNIDTFTYEYLQFLAHHEFGRTHKEIILKNKIENLHNQFELNYWLKKWIYVHEYLLNIINKKISNIILINYEKLCLNDNCWKKLCKLINLKYYDVNFSIHNSNIKENFDNKLLTQANKIYQDLIKTSI